MPTSASLRRAPRPPAHPILGHLREITQVDQNAQYLQWRRDHGDFLRIEALRGMGWYFLAHPDQVGQMLLGSHSTYAKGAFWNRVKVLMGEGLLTSDGARWMRQRRAIQPAFKPAHHGEFFSGMTANLDAMLERFEGFARAGQAFDICEEMMRVTLQNAGTILFDTDFGAAIDSLQRDMGNAVKRVNASNFWKSWTLDPVFVMARARLNRAISGIIARRRALIERGETAPDDLLHALLKARDEAGQPLSETQLHDELMTFLFTGQETTALALTWMWYLLAQNPEVLRDIRAEIAQVCPNAAPTMDELARLDLTRRAFQETLRLYPPVWGIARQTTQAVEMADYDIPSGSILVALPYVTQRHPDFWPDAERFDPDRFLPDAVAARHKYAYFAFGGGPRLCIGQHFAMMEALRIAVALLPRFEMELVAGQRVDEALWATLRPRFGLQMRVTKHG